MHRNIRMPVTYLIVAVVVLQIIYISDAKAQNILPIVLLIEFGLAVIFLQKRLMSKNNANAEIILSISIGVLALISVISSVVKLGAITP